jgi:hypothetical protein
MAKILSQMLPRRVAHMINLLSNVEKQGVDKLLRLIWFVYFASYITVYIIMA